MQSSGGNCSCLRSEGDLQSLVPGEGAAEQCHLCLHSFKAVPRVFPSLCATRPTRRLTKGSIHQWAATSYNPFKRQEAVPTIPWLLLKRSSLPCSCKPGAVFVSFYKCRWVWGSRDQWAWFPWGGKGLSGSSNPAEVVICPAGAQWLPSWELFGFMPAVLPLTSCCCATSLPWMTWTFFTFPASIYSWPVCSHFVLASSLAISLNSSSQCCIYLYHCVCREQSSSLQLSFHKDETEAALALLFREAIFYPQLPFSSAKLSLPACHVIRTAGRGDSSLAEPRCWGYSCKSKAWANYSSEVE